MSERASATGTLEMWGGIECTVNRVGDTYFDQLERNGHGRREDDLDLIAALRLRALRYPVLWERVAPEVDGPDDWSWPDRRLGRLRELDIRPIVGLTHHGSGPRHTSLVDGEFPSGLARYARRVAERYPWVTDFTPINEPMTTARFSGLYGHWYPHGRTGAAFARALVTQCRAVVLSMRAVREVTPGARLIQTEDVGRTYSTPHLAYQADFENERRWLAIDLLCGRVHRGHPMWPWLLRWGVAEDELAWLRANPCPPDILGINHYLTSDRFLDERMERYPAWSHGGNRRERYADVEAVRASPDCPVSMRSALAAAWERYGLPLAVTEAHLGATREEQLRWLHEAWEGARQLLRSGVDVRAVTAWSLFGAFDWNVLVTRAGDFYEPGAFDVRSPTPRPTALARFVRDLATGAPLHDDPVVWTPGWWRRPDRLFHPPAEGRAYPESRPSMAHIDMRDRSPRPLLILGATGTLGGALTRACDARGIAYHLVGRRELDLADPRRVREVLEASSPWAVVNAAGYVRVDDAERDWQACFAANARGPTAVAAACAERSLPFVTFSSDLVFDGARRATPYTEGDPVAPLNVYGRSKAAMEAAVLAAHPAALVIRTSAFFGPWDEANFVTATLRRLEEGRVVRAADDAVVSPTYVPDLVGAALDLLVDRERGVWHLANRGEITWSALAQRAAEVAGVRRGRIEGLPTSRLGLAAPRPLYSALGSGRAWIMPTLDDALGRYIGERKAAQGGRRAA